MLRGRGLTRNVAVPISAGLLADIAGYFETLTAYRDGDPSRVIERLADASLAAIANGRQLVIELRVVRASWDDTIEARRGAAAWRLADLLVRQPVVDAQSIVAELGFAPPASSPNSPASSATACGRPPRPSPPWMTSPPVPAAACVDDEARLPPNMG